MEEENLNLAPSKFISVASDHVSVAENKILYYNCSELSNLGITFVGTNNTDGLMWIEKEQFTGRIYEGNEEFSNDLKTIINNIFSEAMEQHVILEEKIRQEEEAIQKMREEFNSQEN